MTRVREGRPADLPRLRTIQRRALAEPWPELLEAAPDGPAVVLVVEDRRVLGYALAIADGTTAYVAEFAVDPDRQREGHGSTLMSALLARLRRDGNEAARLTVRADDSRARSFYADHGFEEVERVPGHYEDGTDGLVVARSLG